MIKRTFLAAITAVVALPAYGAGVIWEPIPNNPSDTERHTVFNSSELQAALNAAASNSKNDVIGLAPGVYSVIDSQPFSYYSTKKDDLHIRAVEPGTVTLDGAGVSNILTLQNSSYDADSDFIFENLRFENGRMTDIHGRAAGALAVKNANLIVSDSVFLNNYNSSSISGAAIYYSGSQYLTGQGLMTIQRTEFVTNQSDTTASSDAATVYVDGGRANLAEATFTDNTSGSKGTLYLDTGVVGIIEDSLFEGNSAYLGGAVYAASGSLTISGSTFSGNEASQTGGTLYGGTLSLASSEISGSHSAQAGAIFGNQVSLQGTSILDNTAEDSHIINARQSLNMSNSLISGNEVSDAAGNGTVYCEETCRVTNSLFTHNLGAPAIKIANEDLAESVIANSVFLASNTSAIGFKDTSDRASVLNNFFAASLPPLASAQIAPDANLTEGNDPMLDSSYSPVSGSPLIDAGTSDASQVTLADFDYLGNHRLSGAEVDIGLVEFGSSDTAPLISNLTLDTSPAENLETLTFSADITLSDGRSLGTVELWTDEEPSFTGISLQFTKVDNLVSASFTDVIFIEGGDHEIRLRVSDSEGESVEQSFSFSLNGLSEEELALQIEAETIASCQADPASCGIDVGSYIEQGEQSCANDPASCDIDLAGYIQQGKTECLSDPAACGVDIDSFVDQGKAACVADPESCGIDVGEFDAALIPSMGSGDWKLFGTGQTITNLGERFADASIVWYLNGDTWEAFSVKEDVLQTLNENSVSTISTIPAHSGFWVKK